VLTGTALAGTALAGTALAGTGLAGTGLAGTALAGTALAGTALAGTGLAGNTGLTGTALADNTGLAGTGLAGTSLADAGPGAARSGGTGDRRPETPGLRAGSAGAPVRARPAGAGWRSVNSFSMVRPFRWVGVGLSGPRSPSAAPRCAPSLRAGGPRWSPRGRIRRRTA
jgi:hypothetical protein